MEYILIARQSAHIPLAKLGPSAVCLWYTKRVPVFVHEADYSMAADPIVSRLGQGYAVCCARASPGGRLHPRQATHRIGRMYETPWAFRLESGRIRPL